VISRLLETTEIDLQNLLWIANKTRTPRLGWGYFIDVLENKIKTKTWDEEADKYFNLAKIYRKEKTTTETVKDVLTRWKVENWETELFGKCHSQNGSITSRVTADISNKFLFQGYNKKLYSWSIVDGNGRLITADSKIAEVTIQWLTNAFKNSELNWNNIERLAKSQPFFPLNSEEVRKMDLNTVTDTEIEKAIKLAGRKGVSGTDGTVATMYCDVNMIKLISAFRNWFRSVLTTASLGRSGDSLMVLIPKKIEQKSLADLRPIEVDNYLMRVGSVLVAQRTRCIANKMGNTQMAFIPGRSSAQAIAIANDIIQGDGLLILLDISSAYSSTNARASQIMIEHWGFPASFRNWNTAINAPRRAYLALRGRISRKHAVLEKGLRQGNSQSPTLFNLYLSCAIEPLKRKLAHVARFILFADDIGVEILPGAVNPGCIEGVFKEVQRTLAEIGLALNTKKTVVVLGKHSTNVLPNGWLEFVCDKVKYLGITLPMTRANREGDAREKLAGLERIANVTVAYRLSYKARAFIFNMLQWSRLVYHGINAGITEPTLLRIDEIVRRMFGYRAKGSNKYLGRAPIKICYPVEQGGWCLLDYRKHARVLDCFWLQVERGEKYWPADFADSRSRILEQRLKYIDKDLITRAKDVKPLLLRCLMTKTCSEMATDTETKWGKLFRKIKRSHTGLIDFLWKYTFNILPCPEHFLRHAEVIATSPCAHCQQQCVMGPTHWESCQTFWQRLIWQPKAKCFNLGITKFIETADNEDIADLPQIWEMYCNKGPGPRQLKRLREQSETELLREYARAPPAKIRKKDGTVDADNKCRAAAKALLDKSTRIKGKADVGSEYKSKLGLNPTSITMYTDGSFKRGLASWAVVCPSLLQYRAELCASPPFSNNRAELWGLVGAMEWAEWMGSPTVLIKTDSQYATNILHGKAKATANKDLWDRIESLIQSTLIDVQHIVWCRGHDGDVGNEAADIAANLVIDNLKIGHVTTPEIPHAIPVAKPSSKPSTSLLDRLAAIDALFDSDIAVAKFAALSNILEAERTNTVQMDDMSRLPEPATSSNSAAFDNDAVVEVSSIAKRVRLEIPDLFGGDIPANKRSRSRPLPERDKPLEQYDPNDLW
jgi:ribonuclease HI